jgi:spermidine/putrescine transport system substrate-binding protein
MAQHAQGSAPERADDGLSRRALLRRAGTGVALFGSIPAVLAACGGGGGAGGGTAAAGATGTLDYFGWEGEDFKAATEPFRKLKKITLKSQAMASIDDGVAKMQGGSGAGLDLMGLSGVATPRVGAAELLRPIDESKIPNLKNLAPAFSKEPPGPKQQSQIFDAEGRRIVVPTYFGTQGLTYDTAVIKRAPTSWHDVFAPELKGKVGFYNDPGIQYVSSSLALGLNPAEVPKADVQKVVDFMNRLIDQVKGISASIGDLTSAMVAGDVALAFTGYPAMDIFGAAAGKKTLKTTFDLKEGGFSYMEVLGIPKRSDNADEAYAYINELLDPKVNATAADSVGGAIVVTDAEQHLSAATRKLYPYADLDGFLKRSPLLPFAPLESDQFVTQAEWAEKWTALTA